VCARLASSPAYEVMLLCYWYTPLILPHYVVGRQGEVELFLERGCGWT
jgi:hypothetical protein